MTPAKWDLRFLARALTGASWSKDPKRKVGCVIVDDDRTILSDGYNGFPRGIADDARLDDTAAKLRIIIHAEANAIASAARHGHSLRDATAYITRPPCTQCAGLLIQAGIKRVVYIRPNDDEMVTSKWVSEWICAANLLEEAGKIIGCYMREEVDRQMERDKVC